MNILLILNHHVKGHEGGVERVSFMLAKQFEKNKHKIFYLYKDYIKKFYYNNIFMFESNGLEIQSKMDSFLYNYDINLVIDQIGNIKLNKLIYKNKTKNQILVSCFHCQPFSHLYKEKKLISCFIPHTFKGKLTKNLFSAFPTIARLYYNYYSKKTIKEQLKYSDKLCLLSEGFIPRIKENMDIDTKKLIAINNPVEPINRNELKEKEKIILFVGRINNIVKNLTEFIDIWKELSYSFPNWRAKVIGDGPDLQFIKNKYKNVLNIEFLGQCSNMKELYEKASILCLTSVSEGWGMVITEALSYSCVPIAYGSYESVYDLIENGYNGYVIPAFDISKYIEILKHLMSNEKELKRIAENGPISINKFNLEITVNKWLNLKL